MTESCLRAFLTGCVIVNLEVPLSVVCFLRTLQSLYTLYPYRLMSMTTAAHTTNLLPIKCWCCTPSLLNVSARGCEMIKWSLYDL